MRGRDWPVERADAHEPPSVVEATDDSHAERVVRQLWPCVSWGERERRMATLRVDVLLRRHHLC